MRYRRLKSTATQRINLDAKPAARRVYFYRPSDIQKIQFMAPPHHSALLGSSLNTAALRHPSHNPQPSAFTRLDLLNPSFRQHRNLDLPTFGAGNLFPSRSAASRLLLSQFQQHAISSGSSTEDISPRRSLAPSDVSFTAPTSGRQSFRLHRSMPMTTSAPVTNTQTRSDSQHNDEDVQIGTNYSQFPTTSN